MKKGSLVVSPLISIWDGLPSAEAVNEIPPAALAKLNDDTEIIETVSKTTKTAF